MFIKLHTDRTTTIRVNVNHIVSYSLSSDIYKQSTTIRLVNGDHIHVMESPEDIDKAFAPPELPPEVQKEEPKKTVDHDPDQDYMYHYGQY